MQARNEAWCREFEEFMILKNLSPRTIKTYGQIVRYFLKEYEEKYPGKELNDEIARSYLIGRYTQGLDWQTVNSDYSAIQKFFKNVLMMPWNIKKIPRPKKTRKLPVILSRQEIIRIIEHCGTLKQQALLLTVYITGMRLSEVIHVLPPYFNKSRHFGLHQYAKTERKAIAVKLTHQGNTIRTVFEILTHLLGLEPYRCKHCQSEYYYKIQVAADYDYVKPYLQNKAYRHHQTCILTKRPLTRCNTYARNEGNTLKSTFVAKLTGTKRYRKIQINYLVHQNKE